MTKEILRELKEASWEALQYSKDCSFMRDEARPLRKKELLAAETFDKLLGLGLEEVEMGAVLALRGLYDEN